ncbi:MAG: STAS domain-containing protein [Paludibacteraceae bacterium]|jgi:anti-sigma B factor antagonist|nr:STAS domain-containing protein [Paludibacteraceae bacterium]
MKTTIEVSDSRLTAFFSGRLDTAAAAQTSEDVRPLLEATNKEIVLDCTELEYISSSGLRIFLSIRKEAAQKNNKVIIKNINADIRQVFAMTGFISLFDIQ